MSSVGWILINLLFDTLPDPSQTTQTVWACLLVTTAAGIFSLIAAGKIRAHFHENWAEPVTKNNPHKQNEGWYKGSSYFSPIWVGLYEERRSSHAAWYLKVWQTWMICRLLIKLPFYCEKKNLWTELTSADKSYHVSFILVVDTRVRAPSSPSMAFLSGFGTFSAARQDKADQAGSCLCFQSLFRWGLGRDPTADHPHGCLDATLIPGVSMKLPGGE